MHARTEFSTTISEVYDIEYLRNMKDNNPAKIAFVSKFGGVPSKPITEVSLAESVAIVALHQVEAGGLIPLQSKSHGRTDPRQFRASCDLIRPKKAVEWDRPNGYRPTRTGQAKQIIKDIQRSVDIAHAAVGCSEKFLPTSHMIMWKEQNNANKSPRLIAWHCDQTTAVDPVAFTNRMLSCFGPKFDLLLKLVACYNDGIPYTITDKNGVEHSYDGKDHQQAIFTLVIKVPANSVYVLSHYLAGRSAVGFTKVQDEQGKFHDARLVFQHMTKMGSDTNGPRCIAVIDSVHETRALSDAFVTQFASGNLPAVFYSPPEILNSGSREITGLETYLKNWTTTVPKTLKTMKPFERHNIVRCGCTNCPEQASSFILSKPSGDDRGGLQTLESINAGDDYELEDIEQYLRCSAHAQLHDEDERIDDLCVRCYTKESVVAYNTCEICRPHHCNGVEVQGADKSSDRRFVCEGVEDGSKRGALLTNENSGKQEGVCFACDQARKRQHRERDNRKKGKTTRTINLVSHDVYCERIKIILRLKDKYPSVRMFHGKPTISWSTLVKDEVFTNSEACKGMDKTKCASLWKDFQNANSHIQTLDDFQTALEDGLILGSEAVSSLKRKKADKEAKKTKKKRKMSNTSSAVNIVPGSFSLPVPGVNGALDDETFLKGKSFIMTGIFIEVGGGDDDSIGVENLKSMIESFGGKVTTRSSKNTSEYQLSLFAPFHRYRCSLIPLLFITGFLLAGKNPVAKRFNDAKSKSIEIINLVRLNGLLKGQLTFERLGELEPLNSIEGFMGNAYQPATNASVSFGDS